MKWKVIIAVSVVVVLAVTGVAAYGVWRAVRDATDDVRSMSGVDKALAAHEAELRAVPGVTVLGTYSSPGEPPYIVVTVRKITPEVRAAVPATLDGYGVVLKKDVPLSSPPVLVGEVTQVKAATADEAALNVEGLLVVDGDLYAKGYGSGNAEPRTVTVRVPAGVAVWHPMGEGKDFIAFAHIRVGDTVDVTLTERLAKGDRVATAADVEVY